MDALTLGPLLLPLSRLPGIIALVLVLLLSELLDKRYPGLARWGWMTALAGALGGRLVYALQTPQAYLDQPWTLAYFWQPGYSWWGALLGGLLVTLIVAYRQVTLRRMAPVLLGITAAASLLTLALLPQKELGEPLPDLQVFTLEGEPLSLQSLEGKPLLINLWATWCPPCRREMPLLQSYVGDERLTLVILNQGESRLAVSNYLQEYELEFEQVLLDPESSAMQHFEAPGLPATLFYSAEGQQVNRHFGELGRGQIEEFIRDQAGGLDK
ncbi:TlpA disulfide reductase family protein [Marinospirillum perlucidum]|uniref:TlpA disulfide reductase family protein n=1 Tax=Marinospirillum perlucidum TaxID=1982602 RepID=UPI000DF2F19B|nr:TlpA disulfide reductase family protein [Marinospirillum perlucidum]